MPEATQWTPSLDKSQTRNYINLYNKNPKKFTPEILDSIRQHAHHHNVPFYEGDFSIFEAIKQIGGGFVEGFTTFNVVDAPDNEWESVARSVGHLAGFAPGIMSGPLGWAGKLTKIGSLQKAASALRGARGIPLQIAEDIVLPRASKLANKALRSNYVGKIGAFDTARNFLLKDQSKHIIEGAFNLGTASAISSWQHGVDSMVDSFFHGAVAGGVFRTIGNMIGKNIPDTKDAAGNIIKSKKFPIEVSKDAEKYARGLAGSLFMGLPATARGASTPEQVYEYLMGAYFGGSEKPWTEHRAAKELQKGRKEARENDDIQFEQTLDPELFSNWENIPDSVRPVLRDMAAEVTGQSVEQFGVMGTELAKAMGVKRPQPKKIGKEPEKPEGEKDVEEYVAEELGIEKPKEKEIDNYKKLDESDLDSHREHREHWKKYESERSGTEKTDADYYEFLAYQTGLHKGPRKTGLVTGLEHYLKKIKQLMIKEGKSFEEALDSLDIQGRTYRKRFQSIFRNLRNIKEFLKDSTTKDNFPKEYKQLEKVVLNTESMLKSFFKKVDKKTPVVKPVTPKEKAKKSREDTYILTSGEEGTDRMVAEAAQKLGLTEIQAVFKGGPDSKYLTTVTERVPLSQESMTASDKMITQAEQSINKRVEETGIGKPIDMSVYKTNDFYRNILRRDAQKIDIAEKVIIVDKLNEDMTGSIFKHMQTQMAINAKKDIVVIDSPLHREKGIGGLGYTVYDYKLKKFMPTPIVPELSRRTAFFGHEVVTPSEGIQLQEIFLKHDSMGFKDEILQKSAEKEQFDEVANLEHEIGAVNRVSVEQKMSSIMSYEFEKSAEFKKAFPDKLGRRQEVEKYVTTAAELAVPHLKKTTGTSENKSSEWITEIETKLQKENKDFKLDDTLKRRLRSWMGDQIQLVPVTSISATGIPGETEVISSKTPFTKTGKLKSTQGTLKNLEEVYNEAAGTAPAPKYKVSKAGVKHLEDTSGKDVTKVASKVSKTIESTEGHTTTKGHKAIWFGPIDYTYGAGGGKKALHKAKPMPKEIVDLKNKVEDSLDLPRGYYDSVLMNKLPAGTKIGAHKDNEPIFIKKDGTIGSVGVVSFGGESVIDIQYPYGRVIESHRIKSGDVYELPEGNFQNINYHAVGPSTGERLSLTFRRTNTAPEIAPIDKPIPLVPIKPVGEEGIYTYLEDFSFDKGPLKGRDIKLSRLQQELTKVESRKRDKAGNPIYEKYEDAADVARILKEGMVKTAISDMKKKYNMHPMGGEGDKDKILFVKYHPKLNEITIPKGAFPESSYELAEKLYGINKADRNKMIKSIMKYTEDLNQGKSIHEIVKTKGFINNAIKENKRAPIWMSNGIRGDKEFWNNPQKHGEGNLFLSPKKDDGSGGNLKAFITADPKEVENILGVPSKDLVQGVDGAIHMTTKAIRVANKDKAVPDSGQEKSVLIIKHPNGTILAKYMIHDAGPILSKAMEDYVNPKTNERGITMIIEDTSAKQNPGIPIGNYELKGNELILTEGAEVFEVDPTSFKYNKGVYTDHKFIGINEHGRVEGVNVPKNMMTTFHKDMKVPQEQNVIDDMSKVLSENSFYGDVKGVNLKVSEYLASKNKDLINDIIKDVNNIGIPEIQAILTEKGAEPLAEKLLLEILKTNKETLEMLSAEEGNTSAGHNEELNNLLDFRGIADKIVSHSAALKENFFPLLFDKYPKPYIAKTINKFIVNKVLKPKTKNAMEARFRPRHKGLEKGEFEALDNEAMAMKEHGVPSDELLFADNMLGKMPIFADIPGFKKLRQTDLETFWKEFKTDKVQSSHKIKEQFLEVLDNVAVRIPLDAVSGALKFRFAGFTGIEGHGFMVHSRAYEKMGGADNDADAAFIFFGGRKEDGSGQGFKKSWIDMIGAQKNEFVSGGEFVDVKKMFHKEIVLNEDKLIDKGINPDMFDYTHNTEGKFPYMQFAPEVRLFVGESTAQTRNAMGPVVAMTQNMRAAWSSVRNSLNQTETMEEGLINKKRNYKTGKILDLPESQHIKYRKTRKAKEPNDEQNWLSSALVRFTADPANELGIIDFPQMKALLNKAYFEKPILEEFNVKKGEWVESKPGMKFEVLKDFVAQQPWIKAELADGHKQRTRFDLADGINRAFFGYDYNLGANWTFEQKAEFIKGIEDLSPAERSTGLFKFGYLMKDVDTRISIFDRIDRDSYIAVHKEQMKQGLEKHRKWAGTEHDLKKIFGTTILYNPVSKQVEFTLDKKLNNPNKRIEWSYNVEDLLAEFDKYGIENHGIKKTDDQKTALRKLDSFLNMTEDFVTNATDEIASWKFFESLANKPGVEINPKLLNEMSLKAEEIKSWDAAQFKKRNLQKIFGEADTESKRFINDLNQELYEHLNPPKEIKSAVRLLDKNQIDQAITKYKESLPNDNAKDMFDGLLLGTIRNRDAVKKLDKYFKKPKNERQHKLYQMLIKHFFSEGAKGGSSRVGYNSDAVAPKNVMKFLKIKGGLYKTVSEPIPKGIKKAVEKVTLSDDFKKINPRKNWDIRLKGTVIEDITGLEHWKEGKLTEEQAEIVGQLRDILQREPGIRTEKLNEFIMGIYYKMSGDITKSLTMLNAKDMKDIIRFYKDMDSANLAQRFAMGETEVEKAELKWWNQLQFPLAVNREQMKFHRKYLPTIGLLKQVGGGPPKEVHMRMPTYWGEVAQNWIAKPNAWADGKINELTKHHLDYGIRFLSQTRGDALALYNLAMSKHQLKVEDGGNVYKERWKEDADYFKWDKLKSKKYIVDFGDKKGRVEITGEKLVDKVIERHEELYNSYEEFQVGKRIKDPVTGKLVPAWHKYVLSWYGGDKKLPQLNWKAFMADLSKAMEKNETINMDIGTEGVMHIIKSFVAETMPATEYSRQVRQKDGSFAKKIISIKEHEKLPEKEKKLWKATKEANVKKLEELVIESMGHRKGYVPHHFQADSGLKKSFERDNKDLEKRFKKGELSREDLENEIVRLATEYKIRTGDYNFVDYDWINSMDMYLMPEIKERMAKEEVKRLNITNLPSFTSKLGHQYVRDKHMPGWIVDPSINAIYIGNSVKQFYRQISNFMTRVTLHEARKDMAKRWINPAKTKKDKESATEMVNNWLSYWTDYVKEAQGQPSVVSDEQWNNPKMHLKTTPAGWWADNIVSNRVNKIGDMLGLTNKDLPEGLRGTKPIDMQKWSNIEARFELATLMTHPKTPINNVFGGTMHTYESVGGAILKRVRDYEYLQSINPELKTREDVYKFLDKHGIQFELMKYELGLDKALQDQKSQAFVKDLIGRAKGEEDMSKAEIRHVGKKYGVTERIMQIAAKFMSVPERMLRADAFMAHYIKIWERFGGAIKRPDHPYLIEIAKKGVKATQFLYDAPHRPPIARSGLGKVMSRFQLWAWNAVRFRNDVLRQAKIYGFKPGTEAHNKFKRMMTTDMFVMALGSMFMYSLFEQVIPAPYNWLQDWSTLIFGDEEERERAFFGMYPKKISPLQMITPPIARFPVSAIRQFAEDDYNKLADYYIWTMFPFGRMIRDVAHPSSGIIANPMRIPEKTIGLPVTQFAKEAKRIRKDTSKPTMPTY